MEHRLAADIDAQPSIPCVQLAPARSPWWQRHRTSNATCDSAPGRVRLSGFRFHPHGRVKDPRGQNTPISRALRYRHL